ncbi:hypothetical protein, partial [Escherichia coli]|uniref:hypothetical protein n=1 Tax=Escherichia coli TaxID=562 RepID=UPI0019321FD7
HDGDPMHVWDIDENLNWLREQVKNPDFIADLIRKFLLDNPHRVRLTLIPDASKSEQQAKDEQAKLDTIEAALTDDTRNALITQAK